MPTLEATAPVSPSSLVSPATRVSSAAPAATVLHLGCYVRLELAASPGAAAGSGCLAKIDFLPWRSGMSIATLVQDLAAQTAAATREAPTSPAAQVLQALQTALDSAHAGRWNPAAVERLICWPEAARRCAIWKALLRVPFGQTVSYGELARHVSPPSGARAVGQTMNKNPFPLLVPCHRVIQTGGGLGGFGGGLDWKRALLAWEKQGRG